MKHDDYILTPNEPCGCNDRFRGDVYLKVKNYLSEFTTEVAKSQARFNLGIPDKWTLKWGNISGYIEEQEDLLEFLNKFLEDDRQTILQQFNELREELQRSINLLAERVEDSRQELDRLMQSFETFKDEFVQYVNQQLNLKLDRTEFQNFVTTSQAELQRQLNLKVDKSDLPSIKNPTNHPYTTREDESISSVKQALDKLLYTPLQITSFTVSPNEAEIGETVNSLTYNWSYNKFIDSQTFDGVNPGVSARSKVVTNTITTTISKTLTATDGTTNVSKVATITFKSGKYYGASATVPTSASIISGFTRNLNLTKGGSFTVNAGNGQYIYLLVPESMSDIKFMVGGFEGGFQVVNNNFQFTKNGVTTKCILFRSDNPSLGNTTVTIK